MTTATQIIPGALRETNNPLLLKAEIGRPLKRGFTLPPKNFTYGKTSQGKVFGAADTFSWHSKLKPLTLKDKGLIKRDFISTNKAATQTGLVTAQEHFQYRATHDFVQKSKSCKDRSILKSKQSPSVRVYGVPTKPSTPVFDLLEHKYQDGWLEDTRQAELLRRKKEKERHNNAFKGYSETRASTLRRYSPPVDPPPLWQMKRFQNKALPALETFRSADARTRAFRHHSSDCTARTGVFGHGTYEGAKS